MRDRKRMHLIKRISGGIVFAAGGLLLGLLLVMLGILYGIISVVIGMMDYLLKKIEKCCGSSNETEKHIEFNEIEQCGIACLK